jgi:hypothetical protein
MLIFEMAELKKNIAKKAEGKYETPKKSILILSFF